MCMRVLHRMLNRAHTLGPCCETGFSIQQKKPKSCVPRCPVVAPQRPQPPSPSPHHQVFGSVWGRVCVSVMRTDPTYTLGIKHACVTLQQLQLSSLAGRTPAQQIQCFEIKQSSHEIAGCDALAVSPQLHFCLYHPLVGRQGSWAWVRAPF